MASEKAIYWMAVVLLALAATNGLVSEYRGWAGRVASGSIAMEEQASEMAASYANLGISGRDNGDLERVVRTRIRMAQIRSTVARHQAEIARAQVEETRARIMERQIRTVIDYPRQNLVVDVSPIPLVIKDATF